MRLILIVAGALLTSTANAQLYPTVTCTAELIENGADDAEQSYHFTAPGWTLSEAYRRAEDGVLARCTRDQIRFGLMGSHTCEVTSCTPDED